MSTEVKTEKSLETIRKAVIPVVRLLAGRLGWMVDDQTIARIGLSPFPQSPLEESVVQLCVEVCRAYSGSPQALTRQNLVCRVIKIVPWKHFLLERELSQCAEYCVPFYGDDKAKSLQPNGICGRFDKTILSEFQKLPFGKKYANQEKI